MTSTFRNALSAGSRIDRYEIETIIGHGGFGISYRAIDTRSSARVVLKEFLPSELATREADASVYPLSDSHAENFRWGLERFVDEATLLANFRHPNIVHVHRAFEGNGTAYMVMDYAPGESLAKILARQGTIAGAALVSMTLALLDGLEMVHDAGYIHRDIKPSNILLRDTGDPVLLDFGSARQALKGKTRTLTALVSAGYAPLEQYFSRSDLQGPWTDIYGLGATLYHAISGAAPLDAVERSRGVLGSTRDILPPAAEVARGPYPPALLAAVDHALRMEDRDRPRSISQWRKEVTGEAPVPEHPVTRLETPPARQDTVIAESRSREASAPSATRIGVVGIVSVLSLVAGVFAWWSLPWFLEASVDNSQHVLVSDGRTAPQLVALRASLENAESDLATYRDQIDQLTAKLRELENAHPDDPDRSGRQSTTEGRRVRSDSKDALIVELRTMLAAAKSESSSARQRADELDARLKMLEAMQNVESDDSVSRRQETKALLAAAEEDVRRMRLTTPAGNNAYERYRTVLELDADNADALRGLERIVERYIELAERARDAKRFSTSEEFLDRASGVLPGHGALAQALIDLENARLSSLAAAPATGSERSRAELTSDEPRIEDETNKFQGGKEDPLKSSASAEPTTANKALESSSVPLRTVIFPTSAGNWSSFTHMIVPYAVEQLTEYVRSEERLALAFSFYDESAPGQADSRKYWNGMKALKKPDIPAILAFARELDADVAMALFHWNAQGTVDNVEVTETTLYVIDVKSGRVLIQSGRAPQIRGLANAAVSELVAARSESQNTDSEETEQPHES